MRNFADRFRGTAAGKVASAVAQATVSSQGRVQPIVATPSPVQNQGNYPTRTSTFITEAGKPPVILYQASTAWSKVRLRLETAGPVAVSTTQQFLPVTGGLGILLPPNDWLEMDLAMGNNLYIASTTANRVTVIVQPVSWAEQILGGIMRGFEATQRSMSPIGGIAAGLQALAGAINSMLQASGMKLRK